MAGQGHSQTVARALIAMHPKPLIPIPAMHKRLTADSVNDYRLLYAIGPGDGVRAFCDWQSGQTTITETSLTYSGQFFDFCTANGIQCWAISSNERADLAVDGLFR